MEIAITAIGTANPINKQSQIKAAEVVSAALQLKPAEKRVLKSIYQATGIDYRYSVLSDYCKTFGEFKFFPNDANVLFPTTAARMQIYKKCAIQLALQAIQDCCAQVKTLIKRKLLTSLRLVVLGCMPPVSILKLFNT